jgi:PGF-pre-PGF domain-containing protein
VANDISSDSMLQTITVIEPTTPVASFTSNSTTGPRPLSIAFRDTSTGLPASWEWDFGDGNKSISKNPVHEYSNPGNYSVNLTVANERGLDYTQKVNYITVLPRPPSSDFISNVTYGNIPLTVQFNDTSTGSPVSWSWDFGDGYASTEQNPICTYYAAGNYTVKLEASNADGTNSKTATITAQNLNNSSINGSNSGGSNSGSDNGGSSSGSSSGGGGAGGSPEPAKNVKVKELSQVFITSGKPIKFEFTKNATTIVSLNFDSKKTVGKTTTIVEMLKNKSTLTPDAPEGEVYNYLNIWVGNGGYGSDEDNLDNAIVNFRVEKSWLQEKGIDHSSIVLNRYSDKKWNELPTTLLSEDEKCLYLKAEAPGFSPFAITGQTTAKENVIEILPESNTEDLEQNNGITGSEVEKPEGTENTNTPQEEKVSVPGFEIIYCIIGLLGVFLYKASKIE